MLKAIHAQKDWEAALQKATSVAEKLRGMRLTKATQKVEESIAETLTYMSFPSEHWTRIRTNKHPGTLKQRDQAKNQGGRNISGRSVCTYACMRQVKICRFQ